MVASLGAAVGKQLILLRQEAGKQQQHQPRDIQGMSWPLGFAMSMQSLNKEKNRHSMKGVEWSGGRKTARAIRNAPTIQGK